jgi:AcrR family transcriptional regulator
MRAMNAPAPARRPGRPPADDGPSTRERLLDRARELFARHGYAGVTLRKLADVAGVNPALIHYYFGDKESLYEHAVGDTVGPLLAAVEGALAAPNEGSPAIGRIVRQHMKLIAANPWLPPLIMREVLLEDGRLRQRFVKNIAGRGAGLLQQLIEREQAAGRVRADLDPKLATMSLLAQTVFPFLAYPMTSQVFGVTRDPEFIERYAAHLERLFVEGAGARGAR